MRHYLARQLTQLVVVIFGISLLAFGILHVLGDPVLLLLPQNAGVQEFERYRHLLGLDRPLYVQYWKFVSGASAGAWRQHRCCCSSSPPRSSRRRSRRTIPCR